jgi:hypothetical protein
LLSGRFTFVETSGGYNLYLGYHPGGTGTFDTRFATDLLTILDDGARDQLGTQKAWEFIQADPLRVPYLMFRKVGYFFGLERRALSYFYSNNFFGYLPPGILISAAFLFFIPFCLVSVLSFFGMAVLPRSAPKTLVLLFLTAYLIPHLLIMAEERFHLAMLPLLAVYSMAACARWSSIVSSLRTRHWEWPFLLAMVTALLLTGFWVSELVSDWDKLLILFGPSGNTAGFSY